MYFVEIEGEHNGRNICSYIQDIISNWNITLDHVRVLIFEIIQEKLKSTDKKKSFASCSRCGYKVKLNLSYDKETKKSKIMCPVLFDKL